MKVQKTVRSNTRRILVGGTVWLLAVVSMTALVVGQEEMAAAAQGGACVQETYDRC